jgi:TonB family protein
VFTRNDPFPYVAGKRITYYSADQKLTPDSVAAKYRQLAPVDSAGIPNGDLVIHERGRKGWKQTNRLPLVREKIKTYGPAARSLDRIGYKNADKLWSDVAYDLNDNGLVVRKTLYSNDIPTGTSSQYYDNGAVIETDYEDGGRTFFVSWYPTGQIRQVRYQEADPSGKSHNEQIVSYWEADGKQQVIDGNGKVVFVFTNQSAVDSTYEELYDKGILQSGKSRRDGKESVAYTTIEQQPEFQGGMQGLGQFLASTLRYPVDAQKQGQQGRVFVSFIVCTDGTLCDYEVMKGVSPSVDQEALRVVKAMSGKWTPGVQRGERVRVKYNLPINFTLQ